MRAMGALVHWVIGVLAPRGIGGKGGIAALPHRGITLALALALALALTV